MAWSNPVTRAGYHLRRGSLVLWESDQQHFLLAWVERADATARVRQPATETEPEPLALLRFPNGEGVITALDRIHALPDRGPARRQRYERRRAAARAAAQGHAAQARAAAAASASTTTPWR